MQNRREFLVGSGGALAAALAGTAHAAPQDAKAEWRNRQSGISYRRLGRTGFMVSGVVMGGNTIAPDNHEHVLRALDMGLNYLDTAPAYGRGRSEEGYGRVLKSRKRDSFFLTTKVSLWDINRNRIYQEIFEGLSGTEQNRLRTLARDEIERRMADAPEYLVNYFDSQYPELEAAALANVMERQYGRKIDRDKNYRQVIFDSVDESLKRIGADHVDILMCPHGASTPYELENYPEIFEAFETLKRGGKVRHLGVSAHTDPAGVLEAAVRVRHYSAAMVAYNIVNHPRVAPALEHARNNDLGVIAMKVARSVHSGLANRPNDPKRVALINKAVPGGLKAPQKAYVWALRNPNLTGVISEMINHEMVTDNLPLAGQA